MFKEEYIGKIIKVECIDNQSFIGKVVELEGKTESSSGENEIGINYSSGIIMFRESEVTNIEIVGG